MRPSPETGDRWAKQSRHTSQMDRLRMRGEELAVAVSEIACHPFGHLRDLIAFAGSHCLPVGYFILWDFGCVLWDACGL